VTEPLHSSPSRATFVKWVPGQMSVTLDPPPPTDSYLLVAENWFPDWHATVDGNPSDVLRGDWSFITVPVSAGAKRVDLEFTSTVYQRGRLISLISLLLLAAWGGGAAIRQRRKGPAGG